MIVEVTSCSPTIKRDQEPCVFEVEDAKPRCEICGRQCSHTENNWHAGPVIKVSGWFEAQEYHDPAADVWRDVVLTYGGKQLFAGFSIVVTGCNVSNRPTYRYSFHGQQHIRVDKIQQGRTL